MRGCLTIASTFDPNPHTKNKRSSLAEPWPNSGENRANLPRHRSSEPDSGQTKAELGPQNGPIRAKIRRNCPSLAESGRSNGQILDEFAPISAEIGRHRPPNLAAEFGRSNSPNLDEFVPISAEIRGVRLPNLANMWPKSSQARPKSPEVGLAQIRRSSRRCSRRWMPARKHGAANGASIRRVLRTQCERAVPTGKLATPEGRGRARPRQGGRVTGGEAPQVAPAHLHQKICVPSARDPLEHPKAHPLQMERN